MCCIQHTVFTIFTEIFLIIDTGVNAANLSKVLTVEAVDARWPSEIVVFSRRRTVLVF